MSNTIAEASTSSRFELSQGTTILVGFACAAVALRLIFWFYTDRIWEDALISATPARNVWEGFGLTHHASEPRVFSFTSALGELILIAGESIRQGVNAMRIASLFGAVVAIYLAYQISILLRFSIAAKVLLLSYLSADHLQIFFGMSGMETQVATALMLAIVYLYLSSNWAALGVVCGLAALCRPEFVFVLAPLAVAILWFHRTSALTVAIGFCTVCLPWLVFATVYYGSPIPQTIVAKQLAAQSGFLATGMPNVINYASDAWRYLAPFKQYWAAYSAPIPDAGLQTIVATLVALALVGGVYAIRTNPRMTVPFLSLLFFFAYRITFTMEPYFMWYMPPFVALIFLFAAAGITAMRVLGTPLAAVLAIAYALPVFFLLPLDRTMQEAIENGVRAPLGRRLNQLMGPDDTALMEPLGYTGWNARNKTIFDFPGLASRVALQSHKKSPQSMPSVINDLKPTFLALRPGELENLRKALPDTAALYQTVDHITAQQPVTLENFGAAYWLIDNDFTILKKRDR